MCYLVTSMPPSATTGVRTPYQAIFLDMPDSDTDLTPLQRAQKEAERLLLDGHSDVQVWKLYASPKITRTVDWNPEGA